MLREILVCALAFGLATPAMAGERKSPARAIAAPMLPVSLDFLGRDGALTIGGDYVVRFGGAAAPSIALADFESRMVPRFDIGIAPVTEPAMLSLHALPGSPALGGWRLTDSAPAPSAGGYDAVRDAMINPGKPGAVRRGALSAMLVLRIDGETDSAPFSMGGSAAALWAMLPR